MRLLTLLLLLLTAGCDEPKAHEPATRSEFLQRIDARPLPDLATLAARARERTEGSFEDIVKLREAGGPEAVPALVDILRAYRGSGYIHGHAAAQALFRIGGAEAEAAVRDAFEADESWWRPAAGYSFHWDMAAPDRDRFLEQHVLRSTSSTLEVRLSADRTTVRAGEPVTFTITVKNASEEAASLWHYGDDLDAELFLRDPRGHFVWIRRLGTCCIDPPHKWLVLAPGRAEEVRLRRSFLPCKPRATPTNMVGAEFVVESDDGRGGRFEVIAMFAQAGFPRLPPEPPATPWEGRVVCDPIALTIGE